MEMKSIHIMVYRRSEPEEILIIRDDGDRIWFSQSRLMFESRLEHLVQIGLRLTEIAQEKRMAKSKMVIFINQGIQIKSRIRT